MKISLILLNWNGKEILKKAIESVLKQSYENYEILVLDNGSIDGSNEMVEKNYPQIKLIKLGKNLGIIEPRNIGMKNANGELLFILDNDAELKEDAFEKTIKEFENKKLGILSCSLRDKKNKTSVWMHNFPKEKYDDKKFLTTIYSGGAHVIRKSILEKTGYYPKYYFITAEEMDLSLRVLDNDYDITYCPNIIAYHKQRSEKDISELSNFLAMRNMYWVYWRLFPLDYALLRMLKKFFRDFFKLNFLKSVWASFKKIPSISRCPIKRTTLNRIKQLEKRPHLLN